MKNDGSVTNFSWKFVGGKNMSLLVGKPKFTLKKDGQIKKKQIPTKPIWKTCLTISEQTPIKESNCAVQMLSDSIA